MSPTGSEITVNIRNIAVGGEGVGEVIEQVNGQDLLGITAFVPFTAVGETARARVVEKKERYVRCELLDIETRSPERVAPACPYFMNCGGCELQHISYPAQLKAKEEMIRGALKAAKLTTRTVEALEPVIPGTPYGYRRRITLHVDANGRIGFYRQHSRAVVPIAQCPISSTGINEVLAGIQELSGKLQGKISSILLEEDQQGVVAVLRSPYDLSSAEEKEVFETAKKHFSNFSLTSASKELGGMGRQILDLPLNEKATFFLRVPAGHFSQVNWQINLGLIEHAVAAAKLKYNDKVLDLFAGAGNFSLPLARAGASVTAVEVNPRLVSFGRENAKRHNLAKKICFYEQSVEKFLAQQSKVYLEIPTILADPPRSGLGKLVHQLSFARNFLLVSCHLPSFVRDVKLLLEKGWVMESIRPFDMFAQTSYVEILGVLRKS